MKRIYYRLSNQIPILGNITVKQFIKFSMVGVSNTIFDFSIYIILTRALGLNILIANAIAFIIAVTWSYFANKWWTFRDTSKQTTSQYTKFIFISLIGLGLNETILSILVFYAGLWDLLAKLTAVIIVVFWNFWANRAWTFTDRETVVKS
ncbi:MAG: GtrA family protein [Patescibacteria group bacterium]